MRLVANLSDNAVLECGLEQLNWPANQGPGRKKPGTLEARRCGVEAYEQIFGKWDTKEKDFFTMYQCQLEATHHSRGTLYMNRQNVLTFGC